MKGRGTLQFESEEKFTTWARAHVARYNQDVSIEIKEIIIHEKAHFEMAKRLGYMPVYQVYGLFWNNDDPTSAIVESYQVNYKGTRPSLNDLIKILLAPINPSENDLEAVARARRILAGESP